MKIISIILIVIGFIMCSLSSLGIRYAIYTVVDGLMSSEAAGIGTIASALTNASLWSYVNLFGCGILFVGVLLNIIGLFTGKQQQAI